MILRRDQLVQIQEQSKKWKLISKKDDGYDALITINVPFLLWCYKETGVILLLFGEYFEEYINVNTN